MKGKPSGIRGVIRGMERSALMSLLCIVFAIAYPTSALLGHGAMVLVFRLAAALSFAAAGIIAHITGAKNGAYGKTVIAGLAAGALGGVCSDLNSDTKMIVCMCFLSLGNILYIFAFWRVNKIMPLWLLIGALLGGGAAFYLWLTCGACRGKWLLPTAAYCLLEALAVGGAVCVAVCKKQVRLSAVVCAAGTVLSAFGGETLAYALFAGSPNITALNYAFALLYYPGQLCVGLSLLDEPSGSRKEGEANGR
ncbi:MAG: lysoplasmalogenase family protein [Butyrivibrio sp.]|nr:lysoplasmalogenase family protein [Butyrivibrio sp.]